MVKRIDEAFGRLLDSLRSLDLTENTIVVFASDHGDHFVTRNTTHKMSPHDSSIRVPLALGGSLFANRGTVDQLVSLIDLAPTLLDAVGIPPEGMDGKSILPLVHRTGIDQWRDGVLIQTSMTEKGRTIRTKKWKYGVVARDADPFSDAPCTSYHEHYLYDMDADPYELLNLIDFERLEPIKKELSKTLKREVLAAGEPDFAIQPAECTAKPLGILGQVCAPDEQLRSDYSNPRRYSFPRS
jgi:arylsulfatase A-like enzyme